MPDNLPASNDLLIVDDLADNLRVLSKTLLDQGYRVRCVRNGPMAIVGTKASPPDLILLDVRMPEMDGYEVCRQLKSDSQTCDIPIIFLSALDETGDKAQAFAVGGSDYITKPFQVEEVLVRVSNQLMIQRLKKQITYQKHQLAQLTASSPASCLNNLSACQSDVQSMITTILDHSDRLSQKPGFAPEDYAGLQIIHQNGKNLLNLINAKLDSSCRSERSR